MRSSGWMSVGPVVAASAFALFLWVGQTAAAPVLIDDFTTPQTLCAGGDCGSPSASGVVAPNAVGGHRFASIDSDESATGTSFLDVKDGANPVATAAFSNGPNTQRTLHFLWDGGTDSGNDFGLAHVDFTGGGSNDRIRVAGKSDLGATGTLKLFTDSNHLSVATFAIPANTAADSDPFVDVDVLFSGFAPGAGAAGGADFGNITAVTLDIGGPAGLDAIIDFIDARDPPQVPEPTALSLVGLGIAGIGVARRRRGRVS